MLVGLPTSRPRTIEEFFPAPLAAALDRLDVLSQKVLAGTMPGERRSKRRGRSVEFDDFRAYLPGDDPRHIDWNVYARLDRLVVKLFREEEDLSLALAVDASASMDAGEPNKLIYAHRLAMALAYIGLVNHNRVSVRCFGGPGGAKALAPLRGRSGVARVGAFLLDSLAPRAGGATHTPDFAGAMRELGRSAATRGVVIVISDFLIAPGEEAALGYLSPQAGTPRDVFCVQTLSPGEIDPAHEVARGLVGDLRLTDAESGRGEDVTVTPEATARYRAAFGAWRDSLRRACAGRGLAHVVVPTDTPIERLLTATLRKGGMLR